MFSRSPLCRDVNFSGMPLSRVYVSLGGWCGPALILGKLGLRRAAFPFDFSRCTLDGILQFIKEGFHQGFFPPGPPPYIPECVGPWVLYRGQHTAFAHFDLNNIEVQRGFARKISRWNELLDGSSDNNNNNNNKQAVTFFRTISARDPREELTLVPELESAIATRNPKLDFRIVMIVHDQGLRARSVELAPISPRISLWTLSYTCDESYSLFDRTQQAYTDIVLHSIEEENWPLNPTQIPEPVGLHEEEADYTQRILKCNNNNNNNKTISFNELTVEKFPWRSHNNIALIDGIASVGGTCIGVGSTKCINGHCAFCNSKDYHKAGRPVRSERPFTDDEDQLILTHLYRILTGGDKVEVVEDLAHEMKRGTFEVICRIQHLTNSSVKITDYTEVEDEQREGEEETKKKNNMD